MVKHCNKCFIILHGVEAIVKQTALEVMLSTILQLERHNQFCILSRFPLGWESITS